MFTRYRRQPDPKFCRSHERRNQCAAYTYASCLQDSRCNGITVEIPQPHTCGKTASPNRLQAETGLLFYKKQWERKEADVFVDHQILTGIPVLTSPDTLCIVSGGCSCLVPLEQVAGIRTAGK